MHTRGLIQWVEQGAASCTHWAVHTRAPLPGESMELATHCSTCVQDCPIQRKWRDSGALLHVHVGLPHPKKAWS